MNGKLSKGSMTAAIMVMVAVLAAVSCSRPDPAVGAVPPSGAPSGSATAAVSGGALVEAAASNAPWYAERLEQLGFYVFPAPEPLPPFSVLTLKGAETSLADRAGKVVLLNFWATWCPPCRTEMPSIQILNDKLKGTAFEVMAVSVAEKPATVTGFLKDNPYTFPMYLDETGAASAPYATRGIPTTFIVDKQGRALAGIVGARSYDGPEVVALFRELAERLP